MTALLNLLPHFRRRALGLSVALLLAVLTLMAGVALLGVSGWFLTSAFLASSLAPFNLFGPSASIRALSMLRIGARYGERVSGHEATLRLLSDLRRWLFLKMIPLGPERLGRLRGGDLVARLTADIDALDTVFLFAFAPIATALIGGAVLAVVFHLALPPAAWIMGIALLLAAIGVPVWLVRRSRQPGEAVAQSSGDLRSAVLDGVEGHADLIAFDATDVARTRFARAASDAGAARLRLARAAADGQAVVQALAGLSAVGVLAAGIVALRADTLSAPWMVGLVLATLAVFEVVGPIMRGATRLSVAAAAANRIQALTDGPSGPADPAAPRKAADHGVLVFDQVRYGYDADRPVLHGFSLRVEPGERVALVGPSGTGKSTVLQLLLRLTDVQGGAITFDGVDLRDMAQADWHGHVALLAQDAPVFLGTIRDNLRIGDPTADDARCLRMLDHARLGDFVRSLPRGLDTWLGEAGGTLSAGQARRLCLARALLSPAGLIVLDEPTTGLDRDNELAFFADIVHATQGRTVLLVTHAQLPAGTVDRVVRMR
jgi:ATP-binding cassette subfamily C protein CydC